MLLGVKLYPTAVSGAVSTDAEISPLVLSGWPRFVFGFYAKLKELRAGWKACNLLPTCLSAGLKRNSSFSKYQLFRFIGSLLNVK